jgi:pimeloyl-ACP methyl ester carboxylesterase
MQPRYLAETRPWEYLTADGLTLRGRHTAAPGQILHFLSGNGFCGGVYWPLLRRLPSPYRLFVHDIEGHGDSDAPTGFSGINTTLARVRAVMAEQGLDRAPMIGMGHSFGGALTLKLAADHPGLFQALVLLDPILLPPPHWWAFRLSSWLHRNPMAQGARRRRTLWASRDEVVERLRGRGIYRGWSEEALESFADHATRDTPQGRALCCPVEVEAQIFEHPVYVWRLLRTLRIPVLFLYGDQSYDFFPAAARLARRLNPRVETRTAPGGHCFMLEDPQAAAQAIARFLAVQTSGGL